MKLISQVIDGLPLHYQKENNIKFFLCFQNLINYLNTLIEELKGQTSLEKAQGIFLDFIGAHFQEKRNKRDDNEYRKALISKKMATSGLPTTEFLLDVARKLSNTEIIDFQTRYKGEVASQYFRVTTNQDFSKINKFPNLNSICEAGARMYWDLELSDEDLIYNFASVVNTGKIITVFSDFEIDQTMKINDNINFSGVIGFAKVINIGG